MDFDTKVIHSGLDKNGAYGVPGSPICFSTSYIYENTDHCANVFSMEKPGYTYSRILNPTVESLEKKLALLEGGQSAVALSSGMAAINCIFNVLCEAGDNFITFNGQYGGTHEFISRILPKQGVNAYIIDRADYDNIRNYIDSNTKAIFCEFISNPTGIVHNISELSKIAHEFNIPLIVDNSVATPYLCRVFDYGADIVVHSLSKYIGGHGAAIGGVVIDSGKFDWFADSEKYSNLIESTVPGGERKKKGETYVNNMSLFTYRCRMTYLRNVGASLSPMNAFQILQGMETLAIRMDRICQNSTSIAQYLIEHPGVKNVNYPGVKSNNYYPLIEKYCTDSYASGLISFEINGGYDKAVKFVNSLKLILRMVNIGDTKTLVCHPASTTHRQLTKTEMANASITSSLIRLSIGIESACDIIYDIQQALKKLAED